MSRLTNEAHRARRDFRHCFGDESFQIVNAICNGWDNERIQDTYEIPTMSIAAYRANVTRGTYAPFAEIAFSGETEGVMYKRN